MEVNVIACTKQGGEGLAGVLLLSVVEAIPTPASSYTSDSWCQNLSADTVCDTLQVARQVTENANARIAVSFRAHGLVLRSPKLHGRDTSKSVQKRVDIAGIPKITQADSVGILDICSIV